MHITFQMWHVVVGSSVLFVLLIGLVLIQWKRLTQKRHQKICKSLSYQWQGLYNNVVRAKGQTKLQILRAFCHAHRISSGIRLSLDDYVCLINCFRSLEHDYYEEVCSILRGYVTAAAAVPPTNKSEDSKYLKCKDNLKNLYKNFYDALK